MSWPYLNWLAFHTNMSDLEKKPLRKHILTKLSPWCIHLQSSALTHRLLNTANVFSKRAAAHKSFQFLPTGFIHNLSSNICKKILYFVVLNMLSPTEKISGLELRLQEWVRALDVCLGDNYMLYNWKLVLELTGISALIRIKVYQRWAINMRCGRDNVKGETTESRQGQGLVWKRWGTPRTTLQPQSLPSPSPFPQGQQCSQVRQHQRWKTEQQMGDPSPRLKQTRGTDHLH